MTHKEKKGGGEYTPPPTLSGFVLKDFVDVLGKKVTKGSIYTAYPMYMKVLVAKGLVQLRKKKKR